MSVPSGVPARPADSVRVLVQNLLHDDVFRRQRLDLLGAAAKEVAADILLLQEVAAGPLVDVIGPVLAHGYSLASLPRSAVASTAVVTSLRFVRRDPVRLTVPDGRGEQYAACAEIELPSSRRALFLSCHLTWGGWSEHARLQQAAALDQAVERIVAGDASPTPLDVCLGGDFNCVPDSATARFLAGLDPYRERTAQWTDAWTVAGTGCGVTSSAANVWARETARRHGFLDPSRMPERRIDRLLVRGYAYGRPLAPLQAFVLDDRTTSVFDDRFPPSDHWGVVVDLWDPPFSDR